MGENHTIMKIAFVANALQAGGAERTVAYLSDGFVKSGHEVHLVITYHEIYYELNPGIQITDLNRKTTSHKNTIVRAIAKFIRGNRQRAALRRIKPDVVLSIQPVNAELIYRAKKRIGFRLFVSERSNPAKADPKNLRRSQKIMRGADGIIFQTKRAQQFFTPDIQEKSCVISNAIGNPYVFQAKPCQERRKVIAAIGRLHPVKDYDTLIRAFGQFHTLHKDYTLEIYGDGDEKDRLTRLVKELSLEGSVNFMGLHPDAILKAADASCYVLSSRHEGMPNALMEAMAVGLPCVSTDCPNGPAELIEDGVNGSLVPVGDPASLAAAIARMADDPFFAKQCGENARHILETHSIENIVNQYLDFFGVKYESKEQF